MSRVVHCKKDPFDVYIGRPSKWGNPFSHKDGTLAAFRVSTREEAVASYRAWLLGQPNLVASARAELRGKVLGCWCKPASCHGDVLLEIANLEEYDGSEGCSVQGAAHQEAGAADPRGDGAGAQLELPVPDLPSSFLCSEEHGLPRGSLGCSGEGQEP